MRSIKVTSKVRLSAVALSITGICYGNSLDRDDTAASHNQIVSHSSTRVKYIRRNAITTATRTSSLR